MDSKVREDFDRAAKNLEYDNFLLEEGLEVLAAYRSIADVTVRQAVRQLIDTLARANLPLN